jgi:hypothetical protein
MVAREMRRRTGFLMERPMADMQTNPPTNSADPREHLRWIRSNLDSLAQHARADVDRVREPKAQALFETTAEVLMGLSKAYADYEKGNERAWK